MSALAFVGAPWGHEAARLAGVPTHGTINLAELKFVFYLNWSHRIDVSRCPATPVNFHCSLLPLFRGGHPIENQILAGLGQTVITAHRMTSEIDAGPIYGVSGPISLAGTKDDITARFVEPVAKLMRWIIETNPEPTPQVGEPTYFKRLSPDAYREFWRARG